MENCPPGSIFAPSALHFPGSKTKLVPYRRRLQFQRETLQFKTLIQSLKRFYPRFEGKNSDFSSYKGKNTPQSRPILVMGYVGSESLRDLRGDLGGKSGGLKGGRGKTRENTHFRTHSASSVQLRPCTAASDVSSVEGKPAVLSLRSSFIEGKRQRQVRTRSQQRPVLQQLSPRGRFHKVVAAAAASFGSEEVAGWD